MDIGVCGWYLPRGQGPDTRPLLPREGSWGMIPAIELREQGLQEKGWKAPGHPDSGQFAPLLSELDLEPSGGMGRAGVSGEAGRPQLVG